MDAAAFAGWSLSVCIVYMLEQLLEFHLSVDPPFVGVEEAARFLDAPTTRDELRERTRRAEQREASGRPGGK